MTHSEQRYDEDYPVGESPGTTIGNTLKVEIKIAGISAFARSTGSI